MSSDEWEDAAQLASLSPKRSSREGPGSRAGSRPTSPRPVSPRNQRLGADVGTALQSAVEGMMQGDLLDTSVVVDLANSHEAQRKMDDLLPIHFLSWNLKSVQAALVYTLLHMFVLLNQYREVVGERGTYQEYISQLKSRLAQLEDELQQAKQGGVRGSERGEGDSGSRDELLRLRRENAELRQEQARLQASQDELFKINDAWSRDYNSLTRRIEELTSGNFANGSEHWIANGSALADQHHHTTPPHTQPPSIEHTQQSHHVCTECRSLRDQVAELNRQVKEWEKKTKDLEELLSNEEKKAKEKDMVIKLLDSENHAVQLQIQEIGDLQAAARMKEDFRKLQLQMKQKEKQYQDATSQKIQLQQQVDKLRHAFMSIFGVANGTSGSRRHTSAYQHDCRYMSEPLPPPPTPPGLIARGNHFGSLVEKDRQQRLLYDEQVTGFEKATPITASLPTDAHSWPQVTSRIPPRPNTLVPKSNGVRPHHYVACPSCNMHFDVEGEIGFGKMFDHVSYCDSKQ